MTEKTDIAVLNTDIKYIKKALMLAEEMEFNHFWIAMCHLHFGIIYGEIGEIDLCLI